MKLFIDSLFHHKKRWILPNSADVSNYFLGKSALSEVDIPRRTALAPSPAPQPDRDLYSRFLLIAAAPETVFSTPPRLTVIHIRTSFTYVTDSSTAVSFAKVIPVTPSQRT